MGDHGINEKGVQLSWMVPTPFYLMLGAEALQGENQTAFEYHGDGPLTERDGPRLYLGWLKAAPNLYGLHGLQLGIFSARGIRQEEHLGSAGHDDPGSHYLDGHQDMWGADAVYKYTPPRSYGHGALTIEGGYLAWRKDIELIRHNNPARAGLLGRSLIEEQDGLYAQAVYGFAPRWRAGLRGELIGLTNKQRKSSGASEAFDESYRATAMIDWTLTAKPVNIVATTPELGALASAIAGDRARIRSETTGREDPHFLPARPTFTVMARDADLWLRMGFGTGNRLGAGSY